MNTNQKDISDVMIKKDTWFPFTSASIKNVFMMVVDFILIAYCVAAIILAATLGYQKWNDPLNQRVVDSYYPFKSDKELNRVKEKFGVHVLEIVNNEWGCYVNGKWWCAFPDERKNK